MSHLDTKVLDWAHTIGEKLSILADATGSVEGWLRAEAIIAAKQGRFGLVTNVLGEVRRDDLTLETGAGASRLEFKVAWNNKNLFGEYNGTGGIREDIAKLSNCTFREKLVVAFFGFFDSRVYKKLGIGYYATSKRLGVRLQPEGTEAFGPFAKKLAERTVSDIVATPEAVYPIHAGNGCWFGVWVHRVV